jgi:thymidylate kinase
MLRFAYYFSDYIFGQFYVYLRYTRTGTVVLYDRYYFDFIVDSRRSNITIPEKFARFCYCLLMKPDLNFFLYADAATILKRKQELSASTIKDLTDRYKSLFQELGFSSKRNKYHAIENNNLDETISRIIKNTLTVAA